LLAEEEDLFLHSNMHVKVVQAHALHYYTDEKAKS